MDDLFREQGLKPDFSFQGSPAKSLVYAHRVTGEADIYFVSNQRRQFDSVQCTFRVSGKAPELWHPDTGVIEPAPVWNAQAGGTSLRLDLDPAGSVFVVFRRAADNSDHVAAASSTTAPRPAFVSSFKIEHAIYAAEDGTGEKDVTGKFSELSSEGQLPVAASNDALGGDPTPLHRKVLRVDYTLEGQNHHVDVAENDMFTLPGMAALGQPPQWEVEPAASGLPVVKAWTNGQVQLRTVAGRELHAEAADVPAPLAVTGPWSLTFPPHWGAPPSVELEELISWTDHTNEGVRYFSGTATYEKEIEIPAERLQAGRELWLDLGEVKNFAEVFWNGRDLGVLWKPPFRVNVTSGAKPGPNKLLVKITNLWPNRLIGDEHLPPDCEWEGKQLKAWPQWLLEGRPSPTGRLTFTTWHHWTKDAPLLESGLLGPVTLQTAAIIQPD